LRLLQLCKVCAAVHSVERNSTRQQEHFHNGLKSFLRWILTLMHPLFSRDMSSFFNPAGRAMAHQLSRQTWFCLSFVKERYQLPYAHYNPRFVYFLPTFWRPKTFFQGVFFRKVCPYVWLVFNSGFWSRAGYSGMCTVFANIFPDQHMYIVSSIMVNFVSFQIKQMQNNQSHLSTHK
jgi:hypothetical protein